MNRREALSRVGLLVGGTVIGANAFLTGCAPKRSEVPVGTLDFSPENIAFLDEVGETILPKTAASGGAKEAKMTIEELDALAAPQFPMVGFKPPAPDEMKITPDGWLAVVERAIALVGEDHVMLGSDFDGGPTLPLGMRDIRDLPLLTDAMLKRNWSEPRIRKFLGGNLLRVVRQVTEPQKNTGK